MPKTNTHIVLTGPKGERKPIPFDQVDNYVNNGWSFGSGSVVTVNGVPVSVQSREQWDSVKTTTSGDKLGGGVTGGLGTQGIQEAQARGKAERTQTAYGKTRSILVGTAKSLSFDQIPVSEEDQEYYEANPGYGLAGNLGGVILGAAATGGASLAGGAIQGPMKLGGLAAEGLAARGVGRVGQMAAQGAVEAGSYGLVRETLGSIQGNEFDLGSVVLETGMGFGISGAVGKAMANKAARVAAQEAAERTAREAAERASTVRVVETPAEASKRMKDYAATTLQQERSKQQIALLERQRAEAKELAKTVQGVDDQVVAKVGTEMDLADNIYASMADDVARYKKLGVGDEAAELAAAIKSERAKLDRLLGAKGGKMGEVLPKRIKAMSPEKYAQVDESVERLHKLYYALDDKLDEVASSVDIADEIKFAHPNASRSAKVDTYIGKESKLSKTNPMQPDVYADAADMSLSRAGQTILELPAREFDYLMKAASDTQRQQFKAAINEALKENLAATPFGKGRLSSKYKRTSPSLKEAISPGLADELDSKIGAYAEDITKEKIKIAQLKSQQRQLDRQQREVSKETKKAVKEQAKAAKDYERQYGAAPQQVVKDGISAIPVPEVDTRGFFGKAIDKITNPMNASARPGKLLGGIKEDYHYAKSAWGGGLARAFALGSIFSTFGTVAVAAGAAQKVGAAIKNAAVKLFESKAGKYMPMVAALTTHEVMELIENIDNESTPEAIMANMENAIFGQAFVDTGMDQAMANKWGMVCGSIKKALPKKPLGVRKWTPRPQEIRRVNQHITGALQPLWVLDNIQTAHPIAIQASKEVWPELWSRYQEEIYNMATDPNNQEKIYKMTPEAKRAMAAHVGVPISIATGPDYVTYQAQQVASYNQKKEQEAQATQTGTPPSRQSAKARNMTTRVLASETGIENLRQPFRE